MRNFLLTSLPALALPIFTTPSRSDFYPKLSLTYDSAGVGNSPFGLGWNLSAPSIFRKTEKRIPKYEDSQYSDIFILSDAEDLVPSLVEKGNEWIKDVKESGDYVIYRYRPRIEGLFALIERFKNKKTGNTYWRSISKDNVTSIYGKNSNCRIADPNEETHIFKWLIEESYDDKGNIILYEYKQENQENIDRKSPQEKNRLLNKRSYANRYLKRIKYGNKKPNQRSHWLFEVIFDYGEHDIDNDPINERCTSLIIEGTRIVCGLR